MLLVLTMTASAAADDSYAEQVITADAVALGVTLGGEVSGHDSLRNVGLGLTVSAAKSLVLHITLPLTNSLVVDHFTNDTTTNALALAASMALATAIDPKTLAKEPRWRHVWRPDAEFASGGVQVGVATKF